MYVEGEAGGGTIDDDGGMRGGNRMLTYT